MKKEPPKMHCLGVVQLPVKFPPPVNRACPKCKLWQRPCACTNFGQPREP